MHYTDEAYYLLLSDPDSSEILIRKFSKEESGAISSENLVAQLELPAPLTISKFLSGHVSVEKIDEESDLYSACS